METTDTKGYGSIDLLLKDGWVIDPANRIDERMDVAVKDGRICRIGPDIDRGLARKVMEAAGCYVVPGLIDMHCHCYPAFPVYADSLCCIHPDAHMFQSGVTTAVDAGTCGWKDFCRFKEEIIDKARTRILSFINIAADGMIHLDREQEPANFQPSVTADAAKTFGDVVVGIKSAHYWVGIPFDEKHRPWASVDSAVEAGELCGMPCMVDFQPNLPERTYPDLLLKHLRPGDIHTHVYAQQFPILDDTGNVFPYLYQAREKGICFDLGHGAFSFWFRNAVPALRQGFYPDTISTDLYMDNVAGPVISLVHVMSKYLAMGMPLQEVIYRTTCRPAEIIGRPELGRMDEGGCADIAVLKVTDGPTAFADSGRAKITGGKQIACVGTIRAGEVVFNPYGMGMPEWEEAPEAYWRAPGVLE